MPGRVKVKKKCCDSRPRCDRCPIRLLKEGRLPSGYAVHKRRLVKADKASDSTAHDVAAVKKGKKASKDKKAAKKRARDAGGNP